MDENAQGQIGKVPLPKIESATGRALLKLVIGSFIESVDGKIQLRRNQAERTATLNLCKLGGLYFSEMCNCIDGDAMLGATVMACSGFATLLMLACIGYRDIVGPTKAWRGLSKKAKTHTFLQVLQSKQMTIGKLIEIGEELSWFSANISEELVATVDPQEMAELLALVPAGSTAGSIAPRYAKDYRNRLHPAVCLRDGLDMEDRKSFSWEWPS